MSVCGLNQLDDEILGVDRKLSRTNIKMSKLANIYQKASKMQCNLHGIQTKTK